METQMETRFGKYILRKRLGTGGMAEVFLAEMVGLQGFGRIVAIKRMLPHLSEDEEFVASFISEARLGGSLSHPNIVQTLELGREGEHYYLVMEYIDGVTLSQLLRFRRNQKAQLPVPLVLEIASRICDGLEYAHTALDPRGIPLRMVHRDLKPANILLSQFGDVKITDFGVARADSNLRQTMIMGMVKGTVAYMSPEQAAGLSLDHRSDLYSLGAMLFEMLTLEQLYPKAGGNSGLQRVAMNEIDDRLRLLEPFPPNLMRLVTRLLALNPDERHQSAGEVRRELVAVANTLPASLMDLREIIREARADASRISGSWSVEMPKSNATASVPGTLAQADASLSGMSVVSLILEPDSDTQRGGGGRGAVGGVPAASPGATPSASRPAGPVQLAGGSGGSSSSSPGGMSAPVAALPVAAPVPEIRDLPDEHEVLEPTSAVPFGAPFGGWDEEEPATRMDLYALLEAPTGVHPRAGAAGGAEVPANREPPPDTEEEREETGTVPVGRGAGGRFNIADLGAPSEEWGSWEPTAALDAAAIAALFREEPDDGGLEALAAGPETAEPEGLETVYAGERNPSAPGVRGLAARPLASAATPTKEDGAASSGSRLVAKAEEGGSSSIPSGEAAVVLAVGVVPVSPEIPLAGNWLDHLEALDGGPTHSGEEKMPGLGGSIPGALLGSGPAGDATMEGTVPLSAALLEGGEAGDATLEGTVPLSAALLVGGEGGDATLEGTVPLSAALLDLEAEAPSGGQGSQTVPLAGSLFGLEAEAGRMGWAAAPIARRLSGAEGLSGPGGGRSAPVPQSSGGESARAGSSQPAPAPPVVSLFATGLSTAEDEEEDAACGVSLFAQPERAAPPPSRLSIPTQTGEWRSVPPSRPGGPAMGGEAARSPAPVSIPGVPLPPTLTADPPVFQAMAAPGAQVPGRGGPDVGSPGPGPSPQSLLAGGGGGLERRPMPLAPPQAGPGAPHGQGQTRSPSPDPRETLSRPPAWPSQPAERAAAAAPPRDCQPPAPSVRPRPAPTPMPAPVPPPMPDYPADEPTRVVWSAPVPAGRTGLQQPPAAGGAGRTPLSGAPQAPPRPGGQAQASPRPGGQAQTSSRQAAPGAPVPVSRRRHLLLALGLVLIVILGALWVWFGPGRASSPSSRGVGAARPAHFSGMLTELGAT